MIELFVAGGHHALLAAHRQSSALGVTQHERAAGSGALTVRTKWCRRSSRLHFASLVRRRGISTLTHALKAKKAQPSEADGGYGQAAKHRVDDNRHGGGLKSHHAGSDSNSLRSESSIVILLIGLSVWCGNIKFHFRASPSWQVQGPFYHSPLISRDDEDRYARKS
eukprot:3899440-Rhodomonas_salina.1